MTANRFNFRVWDADNCCMSSVLHISNLAKINYLTHLLQSTGAVDVSKREVFEGDICKICQCTCSFFSPHRPKSTDESTWKVTMVFVKWEDNGFCLKEISHEYFDIKGYGADRKELCKLQKVKFGKIVGNIYEDPKLLPKGFKME